MQNKRKYIVKNKKKTKTVVYDYKVGKPEKETINEDEHIEVLDGIVDRQGLKMLASALKDLNDILEPKQEDDENDNSFIEALNGKTEDIWNEEE